MGKSLWFRAFVVCGVTVCLWASRSVGFLLFHTLLELFSVVVVCGVFMLAWNMRRYLNRPFYPILATMWLFSALLDIPHMLAYAGMGIIPGATANHATQFWVTARLIQGLSLPAAFLLMRIKPLNLRWLFVGMVLLCGFVTMLIGRGLFPDCFIEGSGLTGFKIVSEYVVIVLFLSGIALAWRNRLSFAGNSRAWLTAVLIFAALSSLSFTFYGEVYDYWNQAGHILKFLSVVLLYQAMVVSGVTQSFFDYMEDLKDIEWLLKPGSEAIPSRQGAEREGRSFMARLDGGGMAEAVGVETLREIAESFLDLLETTVLFYDSDGRCVLAAFASPWGREAEKAGNLSLLDAPLESSEDDSPSCWKEAARRSLRSGGVEEAREFGELSVYCAPIWSGDRIAGCVAVGYGTPPRRATEIEAAAKSWGVPRGEVEAWTRRHRTRPPYLVLFAKRRLTTMAKLIGEMDLRHRVERERDHERQRFAKINQTVPVGIVQIDADGRIVFTNRGACDILGLSEEQMLTRSYNSPEWRNYDDLGRPLTPEDFPYAEARREGKSVGDSRQWIERGNGTCALISIFASPLLDAHGDFDGAIIAFVDITRQVENEQEIVKLNAELRERVELQTTELREKGLLLERIFSFTHVLLAYMDSDLKIERVNRAFADFFNMGVDHFVGRNFRDILPDGTQRILLEKAMEEGESRQVRDDVFHIVGSPRAKYLDWGLELVKDRDGRVLDVIFSAVDVTRRIEVEEKLRESQAKTGQGGREFDEYERLGRNTRTNVTAALFGQRSIRERHPATFRQFAEDYGRILELALEQKAYRVEHGISELLRDLASRAGALSGGPRDLVEIHQEMLGAKASASRPERLKASIEEGRILLLECMGYLVSYYRNQVAGNNREKIIAQTNEEHETKDREAGI